jgi:hypothetical protein
MVPAFAAIALLAAVPVTLAGRVSFTGIHNTHVAEHFPELVMTPTPILHERDDGELDLTDSKDALYLANMCVQNAFSCLHRSDFHASTLNGAPFTVSIDTGSRYAGSGVFVRSLTHSTCHSDLWIASQLENATQTGKSATIHYAVGEAIGNLQKADLNFAGYTVNDQVFMSPSITPTGFKFGIMGLGPNSGSEWFKTFDNDSAADTAITRIFAANASS